MRQRRYAENLQDVVCRAQRSIHPSLVVGKRFVAVVYFGNNAQDQSGEPVYGMLASYDDEQFTSFWQELELGPKEERHIPISENTQLLKGPRKVPARMVKMLRSLLQDSGRRTTWDTECQVWFFGNSGVRLTWVQMFPSVSCLTLDKSR